MSEQLREVRLYGHLGKRFGRVHKLAIESAREAVVALCAVLDGFEREFMAHKGGYVLFAGKRDRNGALNEKTVDVTLGASEAVYIVPVVRAANFWSQVWKGAVDIFSAVTMIGWVNRPIADAVKPKMPSVPTVGERPEDIPSYAFGSIANYTDQGVAVPIVYGEVIAGSVVASQGLTAVELVAA